MVRQRRFLLGCSLIALASVGALFTHSAMATSIAPPIVTGPAIKIVIELEDEPAAVIYAATRRLSFTNAGAAQATRAQIARIEVAQQRLLVELQRLDATVLYRTQRVYNGVAAIVAADQVESIQRLPGVKAVHPLIAKSIDNWHSVPLTGAPQLWETAGPSGSLDGTGVTIGIIDSGIDYLHADFGGPGSAAYAANDTTIITDTYQGQPLFPTAKVVGGWDFVGDDYTGDGGSPALSASAVPQPDPDPAPCSLNTNNAKHGTHVAGTAAGYGVTAAGATYTGTYHAQLDFNPFKIGPGVAPRAQLYSLRVFGCSGSTDLADQAIEWAVDPNGDTDLSDHLDVINLSLGSPYGADDDTTTVAANNAALTGVIVVAAAGNNGDEYYILNTPGSATRAISVAGSDDGAVTLDGFRVITPTNSAGVYAGSQSTLYDWLTTTLPLTGQLVYPEVGVNPIQDQRTGCYPFNITNTQLISSNIVLLDWTEPSCGGSVARVNNAVTAGARGVLLVDNLDLFHLIISGGSLIPAYGVPQDVGETLKTTLAVTEVYVVMTGEYRDSVKSLEPAGLCGLYTSSARGPRRGDSLLKPDLAAPAVTIHSALNQSGSNGYSLSGTSMATPHVAGALALLRQLHPTWSVAELKALAMNTASTDVTLDAVKYDPGRVGAGRVALTNAVSSPVIAYNATEPPLVSVSFGALEVIGLFTETRPIEIVNKGGQALRYGVSYSSGADTPGVSYRVSPSSITLPPHGSTVVDVTLTADAAQMKHTADPTVVIGTGRSYLTEESGYVVLTPFSPTLTVQVVGNGTVLQVPQALTYNFGTTVTLVAVAAFQSQFAGWSGDLISQTNPVDIYMDGDKVVTATFALNTYSLQVNTVGNGTVVRTPEQPAYAYGTSVTLTAVPDNHWSFVNWSGDTSGVDNPITVTITGDHNVTATFALNNYALDVQLAGRGSGTVTRNPAAASYPYGTVITLTAIPKQASYFAGWSGAATETTNPLTFLIDGNRLVTATFATYQIYLPLTVKAGAASAGAPPGRSAAMAAAVTRLPTMLRIPVYGAVRSTAQMQAAQTVLDFTAISTTTVSLIGPGLNTGPDYPTDTLSLVSAFEAAEAWPNDPGKLDWAELKYLGAGNNFGAAGSVTATTIFFAITAQGNWSVPLAPEVQFKVFIDADRDGNDDFVLSNDTLNGQLIDVFYSRLMRLSNSAVSYPLPLNYFPASAYDTVLFNTDSMILAVPASAIGLTSVDPQFRYHVESYAANFLIAASAVHTYTAGTAGLDFSRGLAGTPLWPDLPTTTIPVKFDAAAYAANRSLEALVLHLHNAEGNRAQAIPVITP